MCGRYRLTAKERYIRDHFRLDEDVEWSPRWNIAPTQQIPTIRQDARGPRRVWAMARWGLIPSWAKDSSIGFKTINAVAETAAEKPAFRDAIRWRRCLVPADGFYEWKKLGPTEKQPYNFGLADDGVFAFAGCGSGGEILLPARRLKLARYSRHRLTQWSLAFTTECRSSSVQQITTGGSILARPTRRG